MPRPLEYHIPVRPLIPASLALFGMLLLISSIPAQNSSAASSGHAASAVTHSAAHVSANSGVTFSTRTPPSTTSSHNNTGPQHTASSPLPYYYFPYVYAFPVPYTADVLDNGASDDNDPDYQGGPTVFDRRGAGPYSYIPPGSESPLEPQAQASQTENAFAAYSDRQPPLDPTILVFKDGHQLEIDNYAVVNQTLYDLTPGHPRRIALADLDLPATQKQNDDRGLTFELPSPAQAN
jgi:hypothetical protein